MNDIVSPETAKLLFAVWFRTTHHWIYDQHGGLFPAKHLRAARPYLSTTDHFTPAYSAGQILDALPPATIAQKVADGWLVSCFTAQSDYPTNATATTLVEAAAQCVLKWKKSR